MRVLYFSIFIILVSVMFTPNALAGHDSDKQWGTVSVDKSILELPYTAADNPQYEKIKIFGTVEEPRSSGFVNMIITKPDGKTYPAKVRPNGSYGNYENFIQICCNSVGKYSVSAEWRGYHIGTVTFDVVAKPKSQPADTPTLTAEPVIAIPDWMKTHAGWWAEGQIGDSTYLLGIQYLIEEGIIIMPQTGDTNYSSPGSQQVPTWIKNNAVWWTGGQIDDITYVSGIQHLVKVGIIKVS
tara:strand:- start:132 stop:851 length:720 start_codon:yes stop_codon:yes gene_type:complete